MSTFIFDGIEGPGVHRAELPIGIKSTSELLNALSVALCFPDYFGENWDAFWEFICDLSWLPPGNVILVHRDLPLAEEPASLATYLSILKDAVENWNSKGSNLIFIAPEQTEAQGTHEPLIKRTLFILFPSDTQDVVERLMCKNRY